MSDHGEASDLSFLIGPGQLGDLIARHPWAGTPLGPLAAWPRSLRTSVSLMLNSGHPMWIGWGPEATFLYNDAYVHVLGEAKHPGALGRPAAEVWAEIWHICGPLADKVFARGEASYIDDAQLFMLRPGGAVEETFYSFSYSPIRDESGGVGARQGVAAGVVAGMAVGGAVGEGGGHGYVPVSRGRTVPARAFRRRSTAPPPRATSAHEGAASYTGHPTDLPILGAHLPACCGRLGHGEGWCRTTVRRAT